jgi:serine protease AprX
VGAAEAISWDDRKARTIVRSISWDDKKNRRPGIAAIVILGAGLFAGAANAAQHRAPHMVSVIVRAHSGEQAATALLVDSVGGQVTRRIDVINGLIAEVPADSMPRLATSPSVAEVTADSHLHLLSTGYSPVADVDSLYNVAGMDGAHAYWNAGYTGQGVDVALIDSGVVPVDGLTTAGKVVNGPDLSFESQDASLQYLDTFGHGTHMAGIIAGRDDAVQTVSAGDSKHFLGMAPDARIVSIKVADAHGQTDVSQVLAAIDWVVQHRYDNGLNIRVLNLSFGTDSSQAYQLDPLAYAAEQAWLQGIVVVVSAGNGGNSANGLADPAIDPYLISVAAADTASTTNVSSHIPASFTSSGDGVRNPDLAAPGVHIASLRVPGSYIDSQYGETATVATRFFRGSGTSQATAIVSGAAALVISQRPSITPDQVKALLVDHTHSMGGDPTRRGSGELSLANARRAATPNVTQSFDVSTGGGSVESARGSDHVSDSQGNTLTGEQDIFGNAVSTARRSSNYEGESEGSDGQSSRSRWWGHDWSTGSWTGSAWTVARWATRDWATASWSSGSWSSGSWSSGSWSSASWSSGSWSSGSWSSGSWSSASWSAASWN